MQANRLLCIFLFAFSTANAADVATVRGIVHDSQHRPLPHAQVILRGAAASTTAASDANGEILIPDVSAGAYTISISATGFQTLQQQIMVSANKSPILHFQLEVAPITSSIVVMDNASKLAAQTSTVETNIVSEQIQHTRRGPIRPTVSR